MKRRSALPWLPLRPDALARSGRSYIPFHPSALVRRSSPRRTTADSSLLLLPCLRPDPKLAEPEASCL